MKNNKLCNKISTAESVNGSRPVLQQRNVLKREMSTDGLDSERNGCWKEEKTVEEKDGGLNWGGDNSPCLCSPLLYAKKKGVLHLYSKREPTPPSLLLSPLSLLCTLKAQVEAGVSQLNIYTFLAFILLHTYLTSMNGVFLTPSNSHSKQVLLAQLMYNN